MAGRNMSLDVIVRLRDMLSGPLRRLRGALDGIANMARRIGLVAGAVAAISFMGPMKEAAAFQQQLLDIAGTSDLVGDAAFAMVNQSKEQYEALGLAIGQYSDTVARGAGQMIASGIDPALIDQSIGTIGRAATAANAEFSDMTDVATQLLQTLKLPADELDDALGALVTAGKLGSFELKDMARYFPTLTSQMAKFGVTGREAVNYLGAALQIARKGTSDPAEAANNLKNFLAKILAPATIKNFRDAGIDIEAVMKDAATKGINPIEAVVQKIVKLTGMSGKEIEGLMQKAKANGLEGGDALGYVREQLEKIHGAGALGEIFGDMQVMDFLIPMLGNIEEYKRIKDEVAAATGAVIDGDFETQMAGLNRQLITFQEIGTQAMREVGLAFGTVMPEINRHLMDALKWMRDLDRETGGAVRQWLAFAAVAVLAATALGALGLVLPAVGAGLALIAGPMVSAGRGAFLLARYFAGAARSSIALQAALGAMQGSKLSGLATLTTGLRGMAMAIPGISGLSGVLGAIASAAAAVTLPVWALAAAVAAVGLAVYNYWEPIKNFVAGFASVVGSAIGDLNARMSAVRDELLGAAGEKLVDLAQWLGLDDAAIGAVVAKVSGLAETIVGFIKAIPGMVGNFLSDIFTMNDYSAEAEASFRNAGEQAGKAMVDAIIGAFDGLLEWFRGLGQKILAAVGRIDWSSIVPGWAVRLLGGDTPAAGPAAPGNDNAPAATTPAAPGKQAALMPITKSSTQHAAVDVRIAVDGPGEVKSATSDAANVKVASTNTGRAIGRA